MVLRDRRYAVPELNILYVYTRLTCQTVLLLYIAFTVAPSMIIVEDFVPEDFVPAITQHILAHEPDLLNDGNEEEDVELS